MTGQRQRGLSFIEIILAVALSAFVLAGILKILTSTKDTHRLEMGVAQVQDSGRYALNQLSELIRYRGYFGCFPPVLSDQRSMAPINWDDTVRIEPVATNAPSRNLSASALRGYTVQSATQLQPSLNSAYDYEIEDMRTLINENDLKVGSDIISIQHASTESIKLANKMAAENSSVVLENNSLGFRQGSLAFIGTCLYGDVFAVSNTPLGTSNVTLEHRTPYNLVNELAYPYPDNAEVRLLIAETLFVADTGRTSPDGTAVYSLFRASPTNEPQQADLAYEELVEGVEFLKILYGQRTDTNRIRYIEAPSAGQASSEFWLRVESIQLALLVRSLTPTLKQDNQTTYKLLNFDVGTGTPIAHDGGPYYRQVFTTTVQLRNRG